MILTITGHRPPKLGGYGLPNPVFQAVMEGIDRSLITLRPERLISGMALGVDQWALDCCLINDIPYTAAVPFHSFSKNWPQKSQEHFQYFMARADKVVYTTEGNPAYSDHLLHLRNQWMVRNSDAVLAVWDGSSGGTSNCIKFARALNKPVYYVQLNQEIWAMAKESKSWLNLIKDQRARDRRELQDIEQQRLDERAETERRRLESQSRVMSSAENAAKQITDQRLARELERRARAERERLRRITEEAVRIQRERDAREAAHRERRRQEAADALQREERQQAILQEGVLLRRQRSEHLRTLAAECKAKEDEQVPDEEMFKPRRVLDID